MQEQLKPDLLIGYTGTTFEVLNIPSNIFSITLKKVVDVKKTDVNEVFSLLFKGPQTPFMPQAVYKLKHAELGELEIFLVPVARDQDGFEYEAVFNQML